MTVPKKFGAYPCAEYFHSEQFIKGIWDSQSQLWFLVSEPEVVEKPELDFLVIGRPGVGGIEFGYRKGLDGIWTYYPLENKFVPVAPNIVALLDGWFSGHIKV